MQKSEVILSSSVGHHLIIGQGLSLKRESTILGRVMASLLQGIIYLHHPTVEAVDTCQDTWTLLKFLFYVYKIGVLPMCMSIYCMHAWFLQKPEEYRVIVSCHVGC